MTDEEELRELIAEWRSRAKHIRGRRNVSPAVVNVYEKAADELEQIIHEND